MPPTILKLGTLESDEDRGPYVIEWPDQPIAGYGADYDLQTRPSRAPTTVAYRIQPRDFRLRVTLIDPKTDPDYFIEEMGQHLNPGLVKRILAVNPVRPTEYVALDTRVRQWVQDAAAPFQVIHIDLQAVDPLWIDYAPVTISGTTVENAGRAPAPPVITLAPTLSTITRRHVTVTDRSGRGLSNYWVRLSFDVSGSGAATADKYLVNLRRRSLPFWWQLDVDGVTAHVDVRVDVPAADSVEFDVYYGTGLANTQTAQKLDQAQLDYTNASIGNTLIVWTSFVLSTAPASPAFSWVPMRVGQTVQGTSVAMTTEGPSSVEFTVKDDTSLSNDADGMVVAVGSGAGTTNALFNLRRVLAGSAAASSVQSITRPTWATTGDWAIVYTGANRAQLQSGPLTYNASAAVVQGAMDGLVGAGNVTVTLAGDIYQIAFGGALANQRIEQLTVNNISVTDGTNPLNFGWSTIVPGNPPMLRAFVRYKLPGQLNWTDAWTTSTPGTYDAAVDVDGAVAIAVGVEPLEPGAKGTLTLSQATGQMALALDPALVPSIAFGAPVAASVLNGVVTNTANGKYVSLNNVLTDNVPLVIDCLNQKVLAQSGPLGGGAIQFSDPDLWLPLEIGTNVVTLPASMSPTWQFSRRWLL